MGKKRHKPEEIVAKLRQVDVLLSQGKGCCGGDPFDFSPPNSWPPSSPQPSL
jgi:hypothetical protein